MEFNQPQLQLILNVVAITAITTLALISILRIHDKHKPAANLNRQPAPESPVEQDPSDIRVFVARRAHHWVASHPKMF